MTSTIAGPSTSTPTPSSQPNPTLYIKNLNTKTKKPELRRQLYSLFSTYGKVIDVVATRADGMRGQAFVVFQDLSSATAARRALSGFAFYSRSMTIEYASKPSKASIIQEHGPDALYDPTIMQKAGMGNAKAGAGAITNAVTTSSAQAEQAVRDKKKARDEARERGEAAATSESESEEEEEEEVQDVKAAEKPVADGAASKDKKPLSEQQEGQEEEEQDEMDMEQSDDDDDDTPGPPAK